MYYLTILKKSALEIGYLLAESPFRDSREQDEYVDIRLQATNEADARRIAAEMVEKHRLTYWELHHIVQIGGCPLALGED